MSYGCCPLIESLWVQKVCVSSCGGVGRLFFCGFFSGSLLVSLFRGCRGRRGVWYLDLVGYVSVFFCVRFSLCVVSELFVTF